MSRGYCNSESVEFRGGVQSLTTEVEELQKNDFGSYISILSYTSASNPYVCPSDGYMYVITTSNKIGYAYAFNSDSAKSIAIGSPAVEGAWSVPVKKGMKLYVYSTPALAVFVPMA